MDRPLSLAWLRGRSNLADLRRRRRPTMESTARACASAACKCLIRGPFQGLGRGAEGVGLKDGDGERARAADLTAGPGDGRGIGQLEVRVAGQPLLQGDPEF